MFLFTGCNFIPDVRHKPQYHNPFPQIQKVAVLPFTNQSDDPTLSGSRVSAAYYTELQSIPGFEVMPL
jgi:TolB-like protein